MDTVRQKRRERITPGFQLGTVNIISCSKREEYNFRSGKRQNWKGRQVQIWRDTTCHPESWHFIMNAVGVHGGLYTGR